MPCSIGLEDLLDHIHKLFPLELVSPLRVLSCDRWELLIVGRRELSENLDFLRIPSSSLRPHFLGRDGVDVRWEHKDDF